LRPSWPAGEKSKGEEKKGGGKLKGRKERGILRETMRIEPRPVLPKGQSGPGPGPRALRGLALRKIYH